MKASHKFFCGSVIQLCEEDLYMYFFAQNWPLHLFDTKVTDFILKQFLWSFESQLVNRSTLEGILRVII